MDSFNRSPVPWLLARPLAGFEWRAAIAPHATLRLSHSFSLVPCAYSLCHVRTRSVSLYRLLSFSLPHVRLSLAGAHSLPLSLSLLTMQPKESNEERTRSSVCLVACVRQRRRTTCASAKNVHTYWCYLLGGKSTPASATSVQEEEAGVPAAPCCKIQGVRDYLAHRIRAHKKDPPLYEPISSVAHERNIFNTDEAAQPAISLRVCHGARGMLHSHDAFRQARN